MQMLAIARKCGKIELLDPLTGDTRVVISDASDRKPEDNPIIGLNLFRKERTEEISSKWVELNIWDLDKCSTMWTAKAPPNNNLGIFTPTWFTSATFLCKADHRKIMAGTNSHQARLYDISAQRRPVLSFDFRETPVKAVTEDLDGYTVYVGNGSGDLASFDMRTGLGLHYSSVRA